MLIALTVGCGDKKGSSEGETSAPSATAKPANAPTEPVEDPPAPEVTEPVELTVTDPEATCDCRMLTRYSLADLESGTFEKLCDDERLVTGSHCSQFDVLRNCIYAAHGNKFKKKMWREHFGEEDWYKPRGDFRESEFSQLEIANVRALKQRASECRAKDGGKVSGADIKLVKKWTKDPKRKVPSVVWREEGFAAGNPSEALDSRIGHWEFDENVSYEYKARPDGDGMVKALAGKNYRTVRVSYCTECDEEEEEAHDIPCGSGCDFYEVAIGGDNQIIGVYLTVAAACPYVYAGVAEQPLTRRGEILRYLDRPALEGTQRLALETTCTGPIEVRLAEEKPEVTFLDAIFLEVDGVRHSPRECEGTAHCEDDGRYTRLSRGESLELTFDIEARNCRRVELVADGFYMPL